MNRKKRLLNPRSKKYQARQDLNPRHSVLETDALPTELQAYLYQAARTGGPNDLFHFCLFMQDFFAAERTIFILFELALNVLAVFCGRVILALAFSTLKSDDIDRRLFLAGHFRILLNNFKKLPSGIGPLTSALPMLCSTN